MDDGEGMAPDMQEFLAVLEEIQGRTIRLHYSNDLHFLCGCANFDPCGHNDIFRDVARQYFRDKVVSDADECKVRAELLGVLERAHLKAQEVTGFQGAKFRIWKPILPPKKRLNESNWEDSSFRDITDNIGSLKKNLEWPLRRALDDVRKAMPAGSLAGETTDNSGSRKRNLEWQLSNEDSLDGSSEIFFSNPSGMPPAMYAAPIPYSVPSDKRLKVDPIPSPDAIVRGFVDRYNEQSYMDALERLYNDRGSQNIEEWAKDLYTTFRKNPDDERAKRLNIDRKECLKLLYDLVTAWESSEFSEGFEQAIDCVFKVRRLVRILSICLPMDRAQALYKMIQGTDTHYGMHWYSKCHLQTDNAYARDHRDEQMKWIAFINCWSGGPTMNWRMFRLLFCDRFGLRSNEDIRKWARPAKVPSDVQDATANGQS